MLERVVSNSELKIIKTMRKVMRLFSRGMALKFVFFNTAKMKKALKQ